MEENNYLYMLSLTRFRVFMICVVFFGLFSLFFFIGLAVGIKSGDGGMAATKEITKGLPPGDGSVVTLGATDPNGGESDEFPVAGDSKPVFKVSPTRPPEVDHVSSGKLLASDRQGALRKPAAKSSAPTKAPVKPSPKSESLFPDAGEMQSAVSSEKYYLQLLVTGDRDKAEKVVDGLVKKSYKAYLKNRQDSTGKNLFLVRVGPYEEKSRALRDLGSLREKGGYKDSFIASQKSTAKPATPTMSRDSSEAPSRPRSVLTAL